MNIARYLLMRLKTLRGLTVVHVGAHLGQEAPRYEQLMADTVVWIEASPQTFATLEKNIEEFTTQRRGIWNKITSLFRRQPTRHICINALISDSDDAVSDFVVYGPHSGAASSMFRINPENARYDHLQSDTVLRLPMKTLDKVLEDAGVDPAAVDVLVMDTQGAELKCLQGATKLLSSAKYIESEVSTESVYEGGVLLPDLEQFLNAKGFLRDTIVRRAHMNAIFRKAG